jgi:hypothetical protein
MFIRWISYVRGGAIPVDPETAAEIAYRYLLLGGGFNSILAPEFEQMTAETTIAIRGYGAWFLPGWIAIVNRHLAEHKEMDEATSAILRSLGIVLQLRMPDDHWDLDTTARLLTERLRTWYTTDGAPRTLVEDSSRASSTRRGLFDSTADTPRKLLLNIVRITGAIPELARSAPPVAEERLQFWKDLLSPERRPVDFSTQDRRLDYLAELAPYEALRLAISSGVRSLPFLSSVLNYGDDTNSGTRSTIDPLLVLCVLADLSAGLEPDGEAVALALLGATDQIAARGRRGARRIRRRRSRDRCRTPRAPSCAPISNRPTPVGRGPHRAAPNWRRLATP